jgi:hypothetical protein
MNTKYVPQERDMNSLYGAEWVGDLVEFRKQWIAARTYFHKYMFIFSLAISLAGTTARWKSKFPNQAHPGRYLEKYVNAIIFARRVQEVTKYTLFSFY